MAIVALGISELTMGDHLKIYNFNKMKWLSSMTDKEFSEWYLI